MAWVSQSLGGGLVALCVMPALAANTLDEAEGAFFVHAGKAESVEMIGASWQEGQDYLFCQGVNNFLRAGNGIGPGDFCITARLALAEVAHTAASFVIDGRSHFGFDGGQGKMFVQGPFFSGKTRYLDNSAGLIKAGEPFLFEVVRQGATVTFLVDGKALEKVTGAKGTFGTIAFRPWRSEMRIFDFSARGPLIPPPALPTQPRAYTIPTLDLAKETWRQVIVERTPGQYLGHPTTVLMPDGKTIFATYPLGHGGPAAVLKKSTDGGLTWSERLPVPDNWATATNCPCIHRLVGPDGVARLFVFEGNGDMRQAVSLDAGKTWTPFEPNGLHCVVAPITIVPISGGRHLALYHQRNGERGKTPLTIWQSISEDGGLTWGQERQVAAYPGGDPCEPAVVLSPDGKQLAALMRENARRYNSLLIVSDDEGATWSEPVELPASLTGDRHMPRYAPDGRLVIAFRDTTHDSPTHGDFVAWVGTYDDIVNLREGQYRVRLLESPTKMDLGYPGLELLPDGTFVATTYAVINEGEEHSVVSVRFTMDDLDEKAAGLSKQAPVYVSGEGGYHTYRIPALVISQKGTLLAFCEGRRNSGADDGDIDLLVKRSFDQGDTWTEQQVIWADGENTIGNPCPVVDRDTGTIWLPFCWNNDRVFVTCSTDDGATWAEPREITADVKPDDWTWYATGPVHGVQLSNGRLLLPCDHRLRGPRVFYSHVVYSDDHGTTWQLGGTLPAKTNECVAVEMEDGRVYLNMRSNEEKNRRAVAWSDDGGETWSDATLDDALVEPVCQGSAVRCTLATTHGKSRILFANPASTERERMTVRVSYDEGRSWPQSGVLHHGPAAYSDVATAEDLTLFCLYECGKERPYETITLARFDLDWLEQP